MIKWFLYILQPLPRHARDGLEGAEAPGAGRENVCSTKPRPVGCLCERRECRRRGDRSPEERRTGGLDGWHAPSFISSADFIRTRLLKFLLALSRAVWKHNVPNVLI